MRRSVRLGSLTTTARVPQRRSLGHSGQQTPLARGRRKRNAARRVVLSCCWLKSKRPHHTQHLGAQPCVRAAAGPLFFESCQAAARAAKTAGETPPHGRSRRHHHRRRAPHCGGPAIRACPRRPTVGVRYSCIASSRGAHPKQKRAYSSVSDSYGPARTSHVTACVSCADRVDLGCGGRAAPPFGHPIGGTTTGHGRWVRWAVVNPTPRPRLLRTFYARWVPFVEFMRP